MVSYTSPPTIFPLYLFPSIPFRRRRSSTETVSSTSSSATNDSSSPRTPSTLHGANTFLRCSRCLTDLCATSHIISKGFNGRHGRAYLVGCPPPLSPHITPSSRDFGNLPNTHAHKEQRRVLVTGEHKVADIGCAICGQILGWKYVWAEDASQKYKEGKFILETKRVVKGVCWDHEQEDAESSQGTVEWMAHGRHAGGVESVEFDSQDEDECDELFAGEWKAEEVLKRRKQRGNTFDHRHRADSVM